MLILQILAPKSLKITISIIHFSSWQKHLIDWTSWFQKQSNDIDK